MYKIQTTLILLLLSLGLQAQNKNTLIKMVCDSLLAAQTGSANEECIRDKETDMTLSCFEITSNPEWVCDFNGDGEDDLLVYFMDAGLGGGGNAYGFEYEVVLLKNKKIDSVFTIFGGGKFSYAHMDVTKVKDGKIYATYTENPMARDNFEDESPLKSVNLVFSYKNGMIVEQSYKRCPIADMDKRIFKSTIPFDVERDLSINDLFEEEQIERLYFDKQKKERIYATLGGCKNINLHFSYDLPYFETMENDRALAKETLLSYVKLLEENTRYSSAFKVLYEKLKETAVLPKDEHSIVRTIMSLTNNWEAYMIMNTFSTDEGRGITMVVNLTKSDGSTSGDFWDQIKR